jgi:hypothetical protein
VPSPFKLKQAKAENALRGCFEVDEWQRVRTALCNPPACERDVHGRVIKGCGGTLDPLAREKGELYADFCHTGFETGMRRDEVTLDS